MRIFFPGGPLKKPEISRASDSCNLIIFLPTPHTIRAIFCVYLPFLSVSSTHLSRAASPLPTLSKTQTLKSIAGIISTFFLFVLFVPFAHSHSLPNAILHSLSLFFLFIAQCNFPARPACFCLKTHIQVSGELCALFSFSFIWRSLESLFLASTHARKVGDESVLRLFGSFF